MVALVDDPPVVVRRRRIVAEEGLDGGRQLGDELVVERLGHEHVVGGDARLAGVHELAPRDAPGG